MKKLSGLKLNALNEQSLNEKEMNELTGGCCKSKCRPKPVTPPTVACEDGGYATPDDTEDNPITPPPTGCGRHHHRHHHHHRHGHGRGRC